MLLSLNKSLSGGTAFIMLDIKFAVVLPPLPLFMLSQTVTLSILIFLIAST